MKVVSIAAVLLALAACVTDGNRCAGGMQFSPEYNACLEVADAASDSGPRPDAGASDGEVDGGSGLGKDCNADSECSGQTASYCLKDPTAPASPGICTVPRCTAADCPTGRYACCDCSDSPIAALKAWPPGVCAPSSNVSQLEQFACHCL